MKLSVANLCAKVHRTPLLHDISFDLVPGELFGLVGPNGSGKSTLMRCLAGLRVPSQGAVTLDAHPLSRMSARDRAQRIALVEQHAETTDRLTVLEAVQLGRTPFLSPLRGWRPEDGTAVDHALDAVEMSHFRDRLWHTLSGGERQRVHIARALAQTPDLLLLDEPTNHLDIRHQLSLIAVVSALPITRVIALHDLNQAMICDRVGVMQSGKLVALGPPADVLTSDRLRSVFGVAATRIQMPEGGTRLHFSHAI